MAPAVRALITDPDRTSDGLYRRFMRRAQVRGLLGDHLVRGEPYLALNALVLTVADLERLRTLTAAFARAFHRVGQQLARDVPTLVELGFPWVAAELLRAEAPRLPLVGRFDFARDVAGHWWLLEFNADTPSGVREAIEAECALRALLPEAATLDAPGQALAPRLIEAFGRAVVGIPAGTALGLVTDAGELEDLSQMAYTARLLAGRLSVPVVLGDVNNLRAVHERLTLAGQPLGALYRYLPFETSFGSPAFAALASAVAAGQVRLLNGLYGLLLQHKGLLARLWHLRDDPGFGPAERAAIAAHLPPTWDIRDDGRDRRDKGRPRPRPAGGFVVKQAFGREGEEVFFDEDLDSASWEALRARRDWVVQQRVAIQPVAAVIPTSGGPRTETGYATVGCFAVEGAWAGFYSRFGGKIITARAKWLATLVETDASTR